MERLLIGFFTLATIFLALFSACSSGSDEEPEPVVPDEEVVVETVKVMSYNIHHANPPARPGEIDLDAIASVIRTQNPDVVALQEVDVNTERSGPFNQAAELADRLDMHYFFGKAIDYQGGEYGVAILSRYPLSETVVHRLPTRAGSNGEPRVLTTAKLSLPGGTSIRFGSTHLDAQSSDENRLLQIEEVLEIASGEELPFIIAGDFNAVPDSEVMNIFDSHFTLSCRLCPATSSARNPVRTIDYIAFHHPERKFSVKSHQAVNEKQASDHLPIVAEINVLE
ncbi:endonuclease/exonuclease/phosphatase family protein [Cesiribacter sp. SM1]|uniref:endonuclease/exonuclease/phosphatase family protein n=1 Tax=Cesiribacter sp. SM1 TaxID=2861196 RepID=UPI001CD2702C|nr:endonuclease/exonuclease/phosphatase family protein [Cesiribacter sp. SM1]